MTAVTATLQGRRAAESIMVDTGTITRSGTLVFDPETGNVTATTTTVHEGQCRLRQPTAVEAQVLFGEEQVTLTRFIACFPWDTFGVQIEDVVTLTASADEDATGRVFKVVAIPSATFVLYKGFGCEVVDS